MNNCSIKMKSTICLFVCIGVAEEFDCNFDGDSEYCGWTRSPQNLIRRTVGYTPLANTGPKYDHTLANDVGYYNFLGEQNCLQQFTRHTIKLVQLLSTNAKVHVINEMSSLLVMINYNSLHDGGIK